MILVVFQGSIHSNIQCTKEGNTHNNIETVIFTEVLHEILNLVFKLVLSGNVKLIHSFPASMKREDFAKNMSKGHQTE